MLKNENPKKG